MPSPPYAAARARVNGGAWQTGGISGLAVGNNIDLSIDPAASPGVTAYRWEIYSYPPGFTLPAGWTNDNGVYFSAAVTPQQFTLTLWGKYLVRLIVNGGTKAVTVFVNGIPTVQQQAFADYTDSKTALEILSPNGLHDIGRGETNQFGQSWQEDQADNWRVVDSMSPGGGGGLNVAGAGLTESPAGTVNVVAASGAIVVNANSIDVGVISAAQHGNQTSGTLHAAVTAAVAGFVVAISGGDLALLSNSGGTAAVWSKVTNTHIASGASVAVSKLAPGSNGQVLTTVAGVPTWSAPASGGLTVAGAGLTESPAGTVNVAAADGSINVTADAIAVGVISSVQHGNHSSGTLHAAVSNAGAGFAQAITAGDRALLSNAGGTAATWAQISNVHIASAAAVAVSKLAAGTDGHVLTTVAGVPTWQAPAGGVGDIDGVTAGAGLTGGGTSGTVTLNVVAHADGSIVVAADSVQVGVLASDAQHGIRGGGTLHSAATNAASGFLLAVAGANRVLISNSGGTAASWLAAGTDGHVLTMVSGSPAWAAPAGGTGDIDGVTAGAGLTGGGTSGTVTLDVAANADGSIVVNANDIQVGVLASDAQHGARGGGTQHSAVTNTGAGFAVVIPGSSGNAVFQANSGGTASVWNTNIILGSAPATAGRIRLSDADQIKWSSGGRDVMGMFVDDAAGDEFLLLGGSDGAAADAPDTTRVCAQDFVDVWINGTQQISCASGLTSFMTGVNVAFGGSPATAGRLRLTDADTIQMNTGSRNVTLLSGGTDTGLEYVYVGGTSGLPDVVRLTGVTRIQFVLGSELMFLTPTGVTVGGHAVGDLANANTPDLTLALNRTVNFVGGGSAFSQRAASILNPTYSADAAQTISVLATLAIADEPVASTNVTATRKAALWLEAGSLAFGSSFSTSTTALIKVPHATNAIVSGQTNSGSTAHVLRWGGGVDTIHLGDNAANTVAAIAIDTITAGQILLRPGGNARLTVLDAQTTLGSALVDFASTVASPVIRHTNVNGATTDTTLRAQGRITTSGNGGAYQIQGGRPTSGLKGAVRLQLNADDTNFEAMVEACEVVSGQKVVALCRGANLTSTQMPSGTGDDVVYLSIAATVPTASPTSGIVLCAFDDTGSSLGYGLMLECPGATSSVPLRIGTRADATQARDILIRPGNATGAGSTHDGGDVTIQGSDANGASGTRRGGKVTLQGGNGASTIGFVQVLTPTGGALIKADTGLGFFGATPVTQQTVTGSRGGNAALASALTALANLGFIVDSSTA